MCRMNLMGMSQIRKKQFFSKNPFCIFCGGQKPATTIEHCPPRGMFNDRIAPKDYEFAACAECNNGSSDQDLIIAWMARIDYKDLSTEGDQRTTGLFKGVHNQNPKLVRKLLPSAVEAKRTNRMLGITPALGKTHSETCVINVTPEMTNAVHTFAKKLAKCVYFKHSEKIFPANGCLLLYWFTNVEFVKKSGFIPFDVFKDIAGEVPVIERNGQSLNDKFSYKFSGSIDSKLFAIQSMFGNSFGLVIFGCVHAGQLEQIINNIRMSTDRTSGALTVLQSSLLAEG